MSEAIYYMQKIGRKVYGVKVKGEKKKGEYENIGYKVLRQENIKEKKK